MNSSLPGVGTNRYSYSFNDPVNLNDPNGNEVYEGDWDDEEKEEAKDAFENSRNQLDDTIGVLDGILGREGRPTGTTKSEKSFLSNYAELNGIEVGDVTRGDLEAARTDASQIREGIGEFGSGVEVRRSDKDPNSTASMKHSLLAYMDVQVQ